MKKGKKPQTTKPKVLVYLVLSKVQNELGESCLVHDFPLPYVLIFT